MTQPLKKDLVTWVPDTIISWRKIQILYWNLGHHQAQGYNRIFQKSLSPGCVMSLIPSAAHLFESLQRCSSHCKPWQLHKRHSISLFWCARHIREIHHHLNPSSTSSSSSLVPPPPPSPLPAASHRFLTISSVLSGYYALASCASSKNERASVRPPWSAFSFVRH